MATSLSLKKIESKEIKDQVAEYLQSGGTITRYDSLSFFDTANYKALKSRLKSKNTYSKLSLVGC